MIPYLILILIMGLILVILVLKPELGMQFKAFTERFAFDAEWKPSKGTRWRFVLVGIFIEFLFIVLLIVQLLK
ncbi:hypothetical protein JW824_11895 [bacterium]|nr:hypothetical protein [bacterium]